MNKVSLAQATANLPSLVDQARKQRVRTVIVDRGQPVAAIVPFEAEPDERPHLSDDEIEAVFDGLGLVAADRSAVDELVSSRR